MRRGRGGRAHGRRWRKVGAWVDEVLAHRAVDIDETYARLEDRPPITLDEARQRVELEAGAGTRVAAAAWRLRRQRRVLRRLRRSLLLAAGVLALAVLPGRTPR